MSNAEKTVGFCRECNKEIYVVWERIDNKLTVWCEECGWILIDKISLVKEATKSGGRLKCI